MPLTEDRKTIDDTRRLLRFMWQQGFDIKLDALEHDALFELMGKLDAMAARCADEPQFSRAMALNAIIEALPPVAGELVIKGMKADLARWKAEAERPAEVCGACGSPMTNGVCDGRCWEYLTHSMALSQHGQSVQRTAEAAHAREMESVCGACGGRGINGTCLACD